MIELIYPLENAGRNRIKYLITTFVSYEYCETELLR
jgi:hypothetical protein